MVQNLHNNLIIAPELADMRRRLKNLESKDGQVLFVSLYNSWCHNAVATFSLCLLAQAYEHASNLLQSLYGAHERSMLIEVGTLRLRCNFSSKWTNSSKFLNRLCLPVTSPFFAEFNGRFATSITRTREISVPLQMSLRIIDASSSILRFRNSSESSQ